MTKTDQHILFTSLGFLAVLARGEIDQDDCTKRARGFAWLIEEFCRTAIPEAFGDTGKHLKDITSISNIDILTENFKTALRVKGEAVLPEDRATLLQIHQHLEERYNNRRRQNAKTGRIADEILDYIDTEIEEDEKNG